MAMQKPIFIYSVSSHMWLTWTEKWTSDFNKAYGYFGLTTARIVRDRNIEPGATVILLEGID